MFKCRRFPAKHAHHVGRCAVYPEHHLGWMIAIAASEPHRNAICPALGNYASSLSQPVRFGALMSSTNRWHCTYRWALILYALLEITKARIYLLMSLLFFSVESLPFFDKGCPTYHVVFQRTVSFPFRPFCKNDNNSNQRSSNMCSRLPLICSGHNSTVKRYSPQNILRSILKKQLWQ